MADKFDPDKYASVNLRWGFFMADHPGAPPPRFELVAGADLESAPPAAFGGELEYVQASIYDQHGTLVARDHKEVPTHEDRWTGPSGNRTKQSVPFERTPDTWRTLCGKALGRALKRAGYPDSMDDLKPLLLWRQRLVELELIAGRGEAAGELAAGNDAMHRALEAAAVPADAADLDHEHDEQAARDDQVADAEVVGETKPLTAGQEAAVEVADIAMGGRRALCTALADRGLPTTGSEHDMRDRLMAAVAEEVKARRAGAAA